MVRAGQRKSAAPANSRATATDTSVAEIRSAELETALSTETLPDPLRARLHPHSTVYLNGAPLQGPGGPPQPTALSPAAGTPLGLPPWATDLRGQQIRYLVLDGGDLYLVAIDQRQVDHGGGLVTVVTSLPVDTALLDYVARGLGRVHVLGLVTDNADPRRQRLVLKSSPARGELFAEHQVRVFGLHTEATCTAGRSRSPSIFCDFRVCPSFPRWTPPTGNGERRRFLLPIQVHSRPSLLYRQLFGRRSAALYTSYIRDGLIAPVHVFCVDLRRWRCGWRCA